MDNETLKIKNERLKIITLGICFVVVWICFTAIVGYTIYTTKSPWWIFCMCLPLFGTTLKTDK